MFLCVRSSLPQESHIWLPLRVGLLNLMKFIPKDIIRSSRKMRIGKLSQRLYYSVNDGVEDHYRLDHPKNAG